ncbi:hypothetical protein K1719_038568 [Acacia pycnantha]|nr:hypothetical protein K1719_038568 [Acacia pycnantha]
MDLLPPVFGALRKDMMEIDPSIAQPEDLTKRILLSKSYDLRLIATKNEGYPRDTGRCLVEPPRAQYGEGIMVNPGFDQSLRGWTVNGKGVIEGRISKEGNRFIVSRNRTHPLDSFSQRIRLEKEKVYSFSACVQLSEGTEIVSVVVRSTEVNWYEVVM